MQNQKTTALFASPVGGLFLYDKENDKLSCVFCGPVVNYLADGDRYYVISDQNYQDRGLVSDGLTFTGNEIGLIDKTGGYTCLIGNLDAYGIAAERIWLSGDNALCFSQKWSVGEMKFAAFSYMLTKDGISVINFTTEDYEFVPSGDPAELAAKTSQKIQEEQARIDKIEVGE